MAKNLMSSGGDNNDSGGRSMVMQLVHTIKEMVTNDKVKNRFIEDVAGREVEKRANAIAQCYDAYLKLEADMKKIKPDQNFYNEDGSVARSEWSQAKLKERNELKAKIEKHERAIQKGVEGDMQDVYNLNNSNKGGGGKDSSGEAA